MRNKWRSLQEAKDHLNVWNIEPKLCGTKAKPWFWYKHKTKCISTHGGINSHMEDTYNVRKRARGL